MIEITPGMIGPGSEEEYGDALIAIADSPCALSRRLLTNDAPDERVLLEAHWIE